MTDKLKNAKCHAEDLELFDELAKHEDSIPKNRPEMFARIVKGYAEYQNLKRNPPEPVIKEVIVEVPVEVIKEVIIEKPIEKIVYVDKPTSQPIKDRSFAKKIISNCTWMLSNMQIFPTTQNKDFRKKASEMIEIANSMT